MFIFYQELHLTAGSVNFVKQTKKIAHLKTLVLFTTSVFKHMGIKGQ